MKTPDAVREFLAGRRFAVAGVSRDSHQAANAIYRKLRHAGYDVVPINPRADQLEGVRCYPNVAAVPGALDGLIIAVPPRAAIDLVRQCADHGVPRVWFHRSLGNGS